MPHPYFLAVEGHGAPKRPHPDLDSARAEARRLFASHHGRHRVYVLETLETIEAPEVKTP